MNPVSSPESLPHRPRDAASAAAPVDTRRTLAICISGMLAVLIVGGIVLRIRALGFPSTFTFDEELFTKNAHNYLLGLPDTNDHPPLGKLIQAVGLLLFGYNSVGWRFASLCFGLQSLLVAFALARALFRDPKASFYAAAFLAGDGFFIAYSRVGLLDGILTCLMLWSVLAAVVARRKRDVWLAAVLVGLATSVKWSGITTLAPVFVALLVFNRIPKSALIAFAVVPVMHVGIWSFALRLTGQPSDILAVWHVMVALVRHHLELGHHQNALASPWYTWLWLRHPIVVKLSIHGTTSRYASSIGNPLLWIAASVSLLAELSGALLYTFRVGLRRALGYLRAPELRSTWVLATGWFASIFPWMVARGSYVFMYHYLPAYAFALIFLAGAAAKLERERPRLALGFVSLVFLVSAYFVPVWGEFPVTEAQANHRLVFRSWRP